jgi:hypothetical protein
MTRFQTSVLALMGLILVAVVCQLADSVWYNSNFHSNQAEHVGIVDSRVTTFGEGIYYNLAIRNETSKELQNVNLEIEIYDADGNFVCEESVAVYVEMKPGEIENVSVPLMYLALDLDITNDCRLVPKVTYASFP